MNIACFAYKNDNDTEYRSAVYVRSEYPYMDENRWYDFITDVHNTFSDNYDTVHRLWGDA